MWNLKKKDTMKLMKNRDRLTDFEKLMVPKEDSFEGRGRNGMGVWDGNVLKLGCDSTVVVQL